MTNIDEMINDRVMADSNFKKAVFIKGGEPLNYHEGRKDRIADAEADVYISEYGEGGPEEIPENVLQEMEAAADSAAKSPRTSIDSAHSKQFATKDDEELFEMMKDPTIRQKIYKIISEYPHSEANVNPDWVGYRLNKEARADSGRPSHDDDSIVDENW